MNKILKAVIGLATISNGVKLNHLAGANASNAGAQIDSSTDTAANLRNSGYGQSDCGCDGCCGGNEVSININFEVNATLPPQPEPQAPQEEAQKEEPCPEHETTEEEEMPEESGMSENPETPEEMGMSEESEMPEPMPEPEPAQPERTFVIRDETHFWNGIDTCIRTVVMITRDDEGNFVESEPDEMTVTPQDCCDANVGLETNTNPCTL